MPAGDVLFTENYVIVMHSADGVEAEVQWVNLLGLIHEEAGALLR
jgi:hypothetical protein